MIDIPGDLVWDLPCVQQASYLEGGPLVWMLSLHLHVNQKSDYDYDMIFNDMSTLVGHFVSWEKRARRDGRGDEREGQGRKKKMNESEDKEEIKTFPFYPYLLQGQ